MGKLSKERKRRKLMQVKADGPGKAANVQQSFKRPLETDMTDLPQDRGEELEDVEDELYDGKISKRDLETTVHTLTALIRTPALFHHKDFKPLRAAIHQAHSRMAEQGINTGSSLSGKISDALLDHRWRDALVALEEMRYKGQVPKLGALQRWVRDCDAAQRAGQSSGDPEMIRVLDSILRTTDPSLVPPETDSSRLIRKHQSFIPTELKGIDIVQNATQQDYSCFSGKFRVVSRQNGSERRTPNRHDFIMYTSEPGTIKLDPNQAEKVKRIDVPSVPGCFAMVDVLSAHECTQILAACFSLGFTPDVPTEGPASESVSVLADNVFWLADTELLSVIFRRCEPFLPPTVAGAPLAGINARWRIYRYVPGAVYRPHIDGAWPASGLDKDGNYQYDAYKGERWSRLTFLVYLNEGFEGGHTTYFLPSVDVGILDAFPVTPRAGTVMCFPHGDTRGSLLHEGSAVTDGAKYIIRADVLYEVRQEGEAREMT
ncbi:prolyl 4-hydroxylase [Polychytrium aggregatum]|uniref:prolyl 4-hydroxylase n=1 Tax=Polychytrium aggregatum TaxID=110093 RepID=UPI0022FE4C11|nr:prolyl 4-hydroxylase [Polychytrium aggregatum]KAI9190572.1 prolyl 4-hydroxylase [Polychytrium aggregatum]